MRLRLDGREHPGDREELAADVAEMSAMLDTLLDYLAGGDGSEPDAVELCNVAELLRALVTSMAIGEAVITCAVSRGCDPWWLWIAPVFRACGSGLT